MNILIVDDNPDDRRVLRYVVEQHGHRVLEAQNGVEGLQQARGSPPDLIVSDALMPVMDGFQFLRAVKQEARLRSIPFIFYSSSYREDQDVRLALSLGADAYLVKPLEPPALWERIEGLLRAGRKGEAPSLPLIQEDAEYLRRYSEVVATKLEEKVRELEHTLAEQRRTEKALRESEAKFRGLAETSPAGILIHQGGRCRYVNAVFETVTGYTREELLGMNFWDTVHPEFRDTVRERGLARCQGEHPPEQYEFKVLTKTGQARWVELRASPIELEGSPAVLATLFDITNRKHAEEELRRSERNKTVLNHIAGIFLAVPDDEMYEQVLAVVQEALESKFGLFGFLAENGDLVIPSMSQEVWTQCRVPGKSVVFPPASWGESLWGSAIREKRAFRSDGPFHTPEGHIRISHFLVAPVVFGSQTIGLLSVANDRHGFTEEDQGLLESIAAYVSPILHARIERDRNEQKRRSAEDTLRKLSRAVEQSPASIVVTDVSGNIEYVNPKFTELTGYTSAEALGKNPRILKSGELPAQEYARLWQTITAGKEWRGEFHNRKKSGELYWELASISPIHDATGSITHFVAVKEDITERRRLEDEFRQAQKLEAVGRLAGGVAHDFNNILTAILMNLSLLRSTGQLAPEMIEGLEELQREANRAASLTRQLLVFSRRHVLDAKPLDLNEVVGNLTKMLRRLIGEDVELVFQGQPSSLWVRADPGMMDQILMNLCVNARDAMPDGGRLTISTRPVEFVEDRPHKPSGEYICLSVADTGCGMDEETKKHLFEPFFTTKEVGKGTGLGLATVHSIVNQHRGWIEVESARGMGSAFRVYLPALRGAGPEQPDDDRSWVRGGHETILLVEDDPALRRLAALGLRKLGYAVLESATGSEALRLWQQYRQRIDLLFADMVLPGGMTGLDLAERFLKEKAGLSVLVTSGYSAERAKPDLLAAKGMVYLAKPYEAAGMARAVRCCLDHPPRLPENP